MDAQYPDLDRAAICACEQLLRDGTGRLPVDVRSMLLAQPGVRLLEWSRAVPFIRQSGQDPEQLYWELKDSVGAFQLRGASPDGEPRSFICVLPELPPARRRFTLAHELGHILLEHEG